MSTHTPGPSVLHKTVARIEVHPADKRFCYAFSLSDEANARLIAAAPTLLAAALDASAYFASRNLGDAANAVHLNLKTAIAKATLSP